MSSAWVTGPDRGLHPLGKEDKDGPVDPNATFHPVFVSDSFLREKAKSSNYGSIIPKVEKVVLEDNDLRPWEEQPTFRPELPPSDLREKAKSSSYGSVIPKRETSPAPSPSFKPEMITQQSVVSKHWAGRARSSSYGRETASPVRPKTAPRPTFAPEYPKSAYREKINSTVKKRCNRISHIILGRFLQIRHRQPCSRRAAKHSARHTHSGAAVREPSQRKGERLTLVCWNILDDIILFDYSGVVHVQLLHPRKELKKSTQYCFHV